MIKLKKKKLYDENPPSSELGEAETLKDELNSRKVYEAPETQEQLFSLLYQENKIEGLQEYFELLEANQLGQNEVPPDIPNPKKYAVITLGILDEPKEPKKSDALAPKKTDSLD